MASGGSTTTLSHQDVARAVDALVDECRSLALWFLRRDYYPQTDLERWRVLESIQKHANVEVFKRAARLKEWLSRHSSATSAGS
jgi:hypothetical protein